MKLAWFGDKGASGTRALCRVLHSGVSLSHGRLIVASSQEVAVSSPIAMGAPNAMQRAQPPNASGRSRVPKHGRQVRVS